MASVGVQLLLCAGALAALSGCGRDELVVGGLGDACFDDDSCAFGFQCVRGVCLPDPDDIVDRPDAGGDTGDEDIDDGDTGDDRICTPGQTRCLDDFTVEFCVDGLFWEPLEFCDFGVCNDGACVEDVECFEGDIRCGSPVDVEICEGGRWTFAGECGPEEFCVDGRCEFDDGGLPDIVPQEFFYDPQRVTAGDELFMELFVSNDGPGRTTRFECSVHITRRRIDPRRDQRLEAVGFPALAPFDGDGVGFETVIPPNLEPGDYTVYVACDPFNNVSELDEDNNILVPRQRLQVLPNEGGLPDLVVEEVFIENDFVQEGEQLNVFGVVCNFGEQDAFGVEAQVAVSSLEDPEDILYDLGVFSIDFVPAGACFDFGGETDGRAQCVEPLGIPFFPRVIVDPFNIIEESNENNNSSAPGQILFVEGCDPDVCRGDFLDPEQPNDPEFLEPGFYELQLCPNDRDFFALEAEPGQEVFVELSTSDSNIFIVTAFAVFDGRSERLLVMQTSDGFIFDQFTIPNDADFVLISVEPRALAEFDYTFQFFLDDEPDEEPDLVALELDFFEDELEAGDRVDMEFVTANFGESFAGAFSHNVYVVPGFSDDPERRRLIGRVPSMGIGPGDEELFSLGARLPQALSTGPHVIVVEVDANNDVRESNENNNINVSEPFRIISDNDECVEDRFEGNNDFNTPLELEAVSESYEGLTACGPTRDFFEICPPAGSTVSFDVVFEHDDGDIDVILSNSDRQRIDNSNGVQDRELVQVTNTEEGQCYILEVFLFAGRPATGNGYSFSVEVDSPNVNECTEALEPNNSFDQAAFLEEAIELPILDFCPRGDADFYQVDLAAGTTATIAVNPVGDQPPGDTVLALHGPDLGFITQRFERAPSITFDVPEDGTYFLRLVTSSGADLFQYNMSLSFEP